MLNWFRRKPKEETRSSASGFTAEVMAAREAYISGTRGVAELTATVQSCVTLWEGGLSMADVKGTSLITRRVLSMAARSLALRGEAVFLIRDEGLIPCMDWDLSTRNAQPRAYRVNVPDTGGGTTITALAGEVMHFRVGSDPTAPYHGTAPLKRAQLSAGMLQAIETALGDVFENMPLGSQVLPMPEQPETDLEKVGRDFRGKRGRILLRESVNVGAAGGPTPQTDWKPADLSPDLAKTTSNESWRSAREGILSVFGVHPGLLNGMATGPLIREMQRHLAQWVLQPIAFQIADEATEKLSTPVTLDVMRPLQAFDTAGRARALAGIAEALSKAKEGGVDLGQAMELVDWD